MTPFIHRFPVGILMVAFIASVLLRLPNLDRPLSKHHEFNTAVILNGTISWKAAGGASVFHYVPLMTYQGSQNRLLQRGPYTDNVGNQVYLSLGAGWYVLPYLFFTALHLPFTPLSLQVLNLLIHFLTLLALYRLGQVIIRQYAFLSGYFPLISCLLFLFMPGPLWFYGNGYVHNAASMPFAISLLTLFLQIHFRHTNLNVRNGTVYTLLGIAGIYFDWFTFFLLVIISGYALFLYVRKKGIQWLWLCLLSGGIAAVAVGLILLQFSSLLGSQRVVQYWTRRGAERSLTNGDMPFRVHITTLLSNLCSCAGITLLCALIGIVIASVKRKRLPIIPVGLWLITCVCYNGFFFNWSYEHEFSMVPVSIVIALLTAYGLQQLLPFKLTGVAISLLCAINVVQYYFINPPGKTSRAGTAYNQQQLLGKEISRRIPAEYRIFSNLDNDPMVEYYAQRSFVMNRAATVTQAKQICDSLQVSKAVWLKVDSLQIKDIQWIK